jgi:hypothetical protein
LECAGPGQHILSDAAFFPKTSPLWRMLNPVVFSVIKTRTAVDDEQVVVFFFSLFELA